MKTIKIYVDGLGLVEGHFSGIGQYILGILRGLDSIIEDLKYSGGSSIVVEVIIPRDMVGRFMEFKFKNINYRKFPLPFRYMAALWHRGKLPPMDLFYGKGVYIFPRFVGMPLLFSKSIVVIYDLSFELHREYSDEGNASFLSKYTRKSIEQSSSVITISKSAAKEIVDFYELAPSFVKLAYPSVDQTDMYRRTNKEIDSVKKKYDIEGNYILALSNLEPRKNLDALIDAYCELSEDIRNKYSLLLVGVSGWKTEQLFSKIIGKVKKGYKIVRPSSYVLDKDKAAIISGASLLVYPSHYEGFGIPPLEALACGVPVIVADNSSLPEAVGDAGRIVNINTPGEIKKSIEEIIKSISSITKKSSELGPKQAERFSWQSSAQIFINTVKEIEK